MCRFQILSHNSWQQKLWLQIRSFHAASWMRNFQMETHQTHHNSCMLFISHTAARQQKVKYQVHTELIYKFSTKKFNIFQMFPIRSSHLRQHCWSLNNILRLRHYLLSCHYVNGYLLTAIAALQKIFWTLPLAICFQDTHFPLNLFKNLTLKNTTLIALIYYQVQPLPLQPTVKLWLSQTA
jgi:hypothetical protein